MRALQLLLTALPLTPALYALARPGFLRHYPGPALRLAALLAATASIGVLLALLAPALLPFTAAVGAAASLVQLWQSRAAYGRRSGLPPGPFFPLQPAALLDETFLDRTAARLGPIFKYRNLRRPVIAVADLAIGLDLLRTHAGRLRYPETVAHRRIPGGFLRSLPPDAHRAMRKALLGLLTPDLVDAHRDFLARRAREMVTQLADAGPVHPRTAAHAMMLDIALQLFFALRPDDAETARWRDTFARLDRAEAAAFSELDQLLSARAAALPDDAPCYLAAARRLPPADIDAAALRGHLIYLVLVTWRDTGGLMEWMLYQASGAPAAVERVRDAEDVDAAADRFISECLRLGQSEYIDRRVVEPFEFRGYRFPAGWRVRICVRECHRDERNFPDPRRFDPDRFLEPVPPERFTPLGAFSHACLGEYLLRSAGRAILSALAQTRMQRLADGPRAFGAFHHWVPSPALLIRVEASPVAARLATAAGPRAPSRG